MTRDNVDFETAQEYFDYNVLDAYVGENTPIYCDDDFLKKI